jgi:H+/Cl- antiporter ClcA
VFCFGLYGSLLAFAADKTHYMNRDDPSWSYINIAIAGFLVLVALFFTIESIQKCNCCKCCCCKFCKDKPEEEAEE